MLVKRAIAAHTSCQKTIALLLLPLRICCCRNPR